MSIFDGKLNLLNEIAALRSLNTGFPELNLGNSFPSLDNTGNALNFLIDLIKNLIGFEQLKEELIRFLTYQTNSIEASIKSALKAILKSKFSCSIDATIPDFLIDGLGAGFNVGVKQIDFFDILKVDPETVAGELIYGNIDQDLNAYLYAVLQGNSGSWKDLIVVTYLQSAVVEGEMRSNVFNVKIHSSWTGKTVNDFINNFIDKVIIFTIPNLVNKIFDLTFGTISSALGKKSNQISNEVTLDLLVEKIISLPDRVIDDSYYSFSNEDIDYFNRRVSELTSGYRIVSDCGDAESRIQIADLIDTNTQLVEASTLIEIRDILTNQLTILSNQATDGLSEENRRFGIWIFFETLIKGIIKALANVLFAPKLMMMFVTYFKVVSNSIGFKTFEDFLLENRQTVIDMVRKAILPLINNFLLKLVIQYLTELIIADKLAKGAEVIKQTKMVTLSLLPIPEELRRLINSFT
jgi:hypothetical protein